MTEPYRYYVRSPDGRAIFGFESPEAAETAASAYGADPHARDAEGQTALDLAKARGRAEIAALLRQAGAEE